MGFRLQGRQRSGPRIGSEPDYWVRQQDGAPACRHEGRSSGSRSRDAMGTNSARAPGARAGTPGATRRLERAQFASGNGPSRYVSQKYLKFQGDGGLTRRLTGLSFTAICRIVIHGYLKALSPSWSAPRPLLEASGGAGRAAKRVAHPCGPPAENQALLAFATDPGTDMPSSVIRLIFTNANHLLS